ncbi:Crp/Fnr family transcriptional regulator [Hansschlegelia plantiphila]|uniref:Crp/Fnr family transcriptional regulator n=1 Tax=Hansschlegelia plantiphila TaxID=374655 RepID=A0A9W6J2A4_9HYPH|nr:Crp/Fnr family transcriptional regulator [Hansschlegelia plantiphila]GLK69022.1 hypothetical protein GCM10008179_26600 [Hansschlegelia plantiphila]
MKRAANTPRLGAATQGLPGDTALFLSETVAGLDDGAHFMDGLTPEERGVVRAAGREIAIPAGEAIFTQGDRHQGIFIIEHGRARVFYSAPSGREITLAYWTPGHFIGGPQISGEGVHLWSGAAVDDCRVLALSGPALLQLITQLPNFALCLIEGLAAKGRSYTAMAQMLGTRSVIERLAQFLLNLGELSGVADGAAIMVPRKITHDQIAAMVGSTRQWVTMMLRRFQKEGVVSIDARGIRIARPERLRDIVFGAAGG